MNARLYGNFLYSALKGEVNLESATIKAMLVSDAYTPNQGTHKNKSDVNGEITSAGYTAGGHTLQNANLTYDSSSVSVVLDADPLEWSDEITARYLVLYDDASSSKMLIGYVDFLENKSSQLGGTFRVVWDSHVIEVTTT